MDQAALIRASFPSYGPAWEAAIDYGIDVSLQLCNLELTPAERLKRLQGALGLVKALRSEQVVSASGLAELMRRLLVAEVDFVLTGGVAAWAHGSALITYDLDIAASWTAQNLHRLRAALEGLNPRPVAQPPLHDLSLLTDVGRLDVLRAVPPIGTFEDVEQRAEEMTMLDHQVRVIALDDLIAVKADMTHPKDRHQEHELRAIRELRAKR
jgi:hypothetical protein